MQSCMFLIKDLSSLLVGQNVPEQDSRYLDQVGEGDSIMPIVYLIIPVSKTTCMSPNQLPCPGARPPRKISSLLQSQCPGFPLLC